MDTVNLCCNASRQRWGEERRALSNDLVHPIVLWVVTKWSKVNTTAATAAGVDT